MDCAEGTYGQLMDYFGDKSKVDATVVKTQLLFVTHLHGDHVTGVPRFLQERDKLLRSLPESERTELFLVVPNAVTEFVNDAISRLDHGDLVTVIPSHLFNPEKYYYY